MMHCAASASSHPLWHPCSCTDIASTGNIAPPAAVSMAPSSGVLRVRTPAHLNWTPMCRQLHCSRSWGVLRVRTPAHLNGDQCAVSCAVHEARELEVRFRTWEASALGGRAAAWYRRVPKVAFLMVHVLSAVGQHVSGPTAGIRAHRAERKSHVTWR